MKTNWLLWEPHSLTKLRIEIASTDMGRRFYVFLACLAATLLFTITARDAGAQNWSQTPGEVTEIAASGDSTVSVWGLGPDGKAYQWNEDSSTWEDYGGEAELIAVTADGRPWVVQNKQIYRLRNRNWQNMPGKAEAIAAGGGTVWVIGDDDAVYSWSSEAFEWQNHGGEAAEIAVTSENRPWVIEGEQIYRLRGQTWQNMPGKATAIAAGGGTVWCVGDDETVYKWDEESFTWQDFGGKADRIAVTSEGVPWVVEDGARGLQVYRLR